MSPSPLPQDQPDCSKSFDDGHARSVKAARAREAEKAMKERPHGADCLIFCDSAVSERLGRVGKGP
jgi:hypothetical protein